MIISKGWQYMAMIALALVALVAVGCDTTESSDYYGPQVVRVSPSFGSEAVAVNSVVAATFNELLDITTVDEASFIVNSIGITATQVVGNVVASGNIATFSPMANLIANTPHVVMLGTGIADQFGNTMDLMYSWYFITGAAAKPSSLKALSAVEGDSVSAVVDEMGRLWVAEPSANRVYMYKAPTDASASLVLGQMDILATEPSPGIDGLDAPSDVLVTGDRVVVSDSGNNRLLIWNSIPEFNGAPADVVLGQSDFNTAAPSCGPAGLDNPGGLYLIDGDLAVSDRDNSRVVFWSGVPTTNGAPAYKVQGQPDLYTCP